MITRQNPYSYRASNLVDLSSGKDREKKKEGKEREMDLLEGASVVQ